MLYGDRAYFIAYARSRTKESLWRASTRGREDDRAKEEDSGVAERLGTGGTGGGVPAVYHRRLGRAK